MIYERPATVRYSRPRECNTRHASLPEDPRPLCGRPLDPRTLRGWNGRHCPASQLPARTDKCRSTRRLGDTPCLPCVCAPCAPPVRACEGEGDQDLPGGQLRQLFARPAGHAAARYFGTNDFYPFVRVELKECDPETFKLLEKVWSETRVNESQPKLSEWPKAVNQMSRVCALPNCIAFLHFPVINLPVCSSCDRLISPLPGRSFHPGRPRPKTGVR